MSLNGFLKRLLALFSSKPYCQKLVRSERYQANYKTWIQNRSYLNLTAAFYKAYHYKKAGIQCAYRVQLIQEQGREGVIFFHDPTIAATDFSYFFDYLKDETLQHGYKLKSADRRKLIHDRYTQHIESYYLTPAPTDIPGTSVCNQVYGNILIEYTLVNHHPGYIRVISNAYADPHFSKALPFSQFLSAIMHSTEI